MEVRSECCAATTYEIPFRRLGRSFPPVVALVPSRTAVAASSGTTSQPRSPSGVEAFRVRISTPGRSSQGLSLCARVRLRTVSADPKARRSRFLREGGNHTLYINRIAKKVSTILRVTAWIERVARRPATPSQRRTPALRRRRPPHVPGPVRRRPPPSQPGPKSSRPLPLGDPRSSILGDPVARSFPETAPDRPETASPAVSGGPRTSTQVGNLLPRTAPWGGSEPIDSRPGPPPRPRARRVPAAARRRLVFR